MPLDQRVAVEMLMRPGDLPDVGVLLARPAWMADAACAEHPEVNFFPSRGESVEPARAVCRSCLVAAECFAYALANPGVDGVWAGTSLRQRRRLRRSITADN